jgi:uncharacterized membrane protein YedE/YeeE
MPIDWIYGLVGGLLIGFAGVILLLGNGHIMGASGIIGSLVDQTSGAATPERAAFLFTLVLVPALLQIGSPVKTGTIQSPLLLICAGICVGIGNRIANGCTSGHGACGISRFSVRGIIATVVYIVGCSYRFCFASDYGRAVMRILLALLSGGLFGASLHISGMTDTGKVQGFLDLFGAWDPTLAFVMGGAIVSMAIAWPMVPGRSPLAGGTFAFPHEHRLDNKLILGALLFGIGWGLIGLCPGPAIASLSYGGWTGAVFFIATLVGMLIAPFMVRRVDDMYARA